MADGGRYSRQPSRPLIWLNLNGDYATPFILPYTWYAQQRIFWQLPKPLSVSITADGVKDPEIYKGLAQEDRQFGLKVHFNQATVLERYSGYHLADIRRLGEAWVHFDLARDACPCTLCVADGQGRLPGTGVAGGAAAHPGALGEGPGRTCGGEAPVSAGGRVQHAAAALQQAAGDAAGADPAFGRGLGYGQAPDGGVGGSGGTQEAAAGLDGSATGAGGGLGGDAAGGGADGGSREAAGGGVQGARVQPGGAGFGGAGGSSSRNKAGEDSEESTATEGGYEARPHGQPHTSNPLKPGYCRCPCHTWRKYWPRPDDRSQHAELEQLVQDAVRPWAKERQRGGAAQRRQRALRAGGRRGSADGGSGSERDGTADGQGHGSDEDWYGEGSDEDYVGGGGGGRKRRRGRGRRGAAEAPEREPRRKRGRGAGRLDAAQSHGRTSQGVGGRREARTAAAGAEDAWIGGPEAGPARVGSSEQLGSGVAGTAQGVWRTGALRGAGRGGGKGAPPPLGLDELLAHHQQQPHPWVAPAVAQDGGSGCPLVLLPLNGQAQPESPRVAVPRLPARCEGLIREELEVPQSLLSVGPLGRLPSAVSVQVQQDGRVLPQVHVCKLQHDGYVTYAAVPRTVVGCVFLGWELLAEDALLLRTETVLHHEPLALAADLGAGAGARLGLGTAIGAEPPLRHAAGEWAGGEQAWAQQPRVAPRAQAAQHVRLGEAGAGGQSDDEVVFVGEVVKSPGAAAPRGLAAGAPRSGAGALLLHPANPRHACPAPVPVSAPVGLPPPLHSLALGVVAAPPLPLLLTCGEVIMEADVVREFASYTGRMPDQVLLEVDGQLTGQPYPMSVFTPCGTERLTPLHLRAYPKGPEPGVLLRGVPPACLGLSLTGWGMVEHDGVDVMVLRAATSLASKPAPAPRPSPAERAATAKRAHLQQQQLAELQQLLQAQRAPRPQEQAQEEAHALLVQQRTRGPPRRATDDAPLSGLPPCGPRTSSPQPPQCPLPLPALPIPPLTVNVRGRPSRPAWDVMPMESTPHTLPAGSVINTWLPLDPELHARLGALFGYSMLLVELDGFVDLATNAPCVCIKQEGRPLAATVQAPMHARSTHFLGWGLAPGGTLVLRAVTAWPPPALHPTAEGNAGAARSAMAVHLAAQVGAFMLADNEARRRRHCQERAFARKAVRELRGLAPHRPPRPPGGDRGARRDSGSAGSGGLPEAGRPGDEGSEEEDEEEDDAETLELLARCGLSRWSPVLEPPSARPRRTASLQDVYAYAPVLPSNVLAASSLCPQDSAATASGGGAAARAAGSSGRGSGSHGAPPPVARAASSGRRPAAAAAQGAAALAPFGGEGSVMCPMGSGRGLLLQPLERGHEQ